MTTLFDETVHALAVDAHDPPGCRFCSRPLMHQCDGRELTPGTVFLHDGAEETVHEVHEMRITRRATVTTVSGKVVCFDRESEPVTVVL